MDLEDARIRICNVLKGLDKKYPQLIGEPFYIGVSSLPEIKPPGLPLEQCTVNIGFCCLEADRFIMASAIRKELVKAVNDLMYGQSDSAIHIRVEESPK